jgi:hypothetical protein
MYSFFQVHDQSSSLYAVRKADIVYVPYDAVAKDVVRYYLISKDRVVIKDPTLDRP